MEADGAMARLNEGDAFADEDGDNIDAELVDSGSEGDLAGKLDDP